MRNEWTGINVCVMSGLVLACVCISVTSIESCVLRGRYSGEYRNLVLCVASIESCVVCDEYRILCCRRRV